MQLKYSLIGYDPYLAREYVCHGIWGPPYYMGAPRNSLFASLTEKSHAFHMQIMRGTHVTYMCV